jgi:hypothetical protein
MQIAAQSQDSFVCIAGTRQSRDELGNVLRAAGLHGDIDGRVAQVHTVVGAVIAGLHDIGAMVCQDAREPV